MEEKPEKSEEEKSDTEEENRNSTESQNGVVERIKDIIIPKNDTRQYLGLILKNKLKVLLISDPETDKAAGSLAVGVGALADPLDKQGMAHFVEHALFISNEKYPEENSFKNFVVQNGGTTNALTYGTETIYYFDVAPPKLSESLDRFAQFFLTPTFIEDKIEKEIQAVHFEFENSMTDDVRRQVRVRRLMGDPKHDYNKFDVGNKDTLKNDGQLRNKVIEFYDKWYSSNIMSLTVLGKESLEEMEKIVVPLFVVLKNKNIEMYFNQGHPYSKPFCQKKINIIPFREIRELILFFPLPDYTYQPGGVDSLSYLTFFLGHECPGSLLSQLKEKEYVSSCYAESYTYSGFGFLDIVVSLTQGIYKNNEIVEMAFQYIKMLKSKPLEKRFFDEIKTVRQIHFDNQDRVNPIFYVRTLSSYLNKFSFKRAISGESLIHEFNPDKIMEILNLLSVDNLSLLVISPIFTKIGKNWNFSVDPIYNVQYYPEKLQKADLEKWKNVDFFEKMTLPAANRFIPNVFDLKEPKQESKQSSSSSNVDEPKMIFHQNEFRVWHLHDSKYKVPKAFFGILFRSNLLYLTPVNKNSMQIFLELFKDYADEQFYSASLVGISYHISPKLFGLEIVVKGFNDKLENFLESFFQEFFNFKISPNRYAIYKDCYINKLESFSAKSVTSLLVSFLEFVLMPNSWMENELTDAMAEVNITDMKNLVTNILTHSKMEFFAHGNVSDGEAITLAKKVHEIIASKNKIYPINQCVLYDMYRDLKLNRCRTYEFITVNNRHENHGLLMFFQVGPEDLHLRTMVELIHQMMIAPFFTQIRTKEQLAYMSFLNVNFSWTGTIGFQIMIQSTYEVDYLETRIDEFIKNYLEQLQKMTPEAFEIEKKSYLTKLSETPKSLFACSFKHWTEIACSQYVFNRNQKQINCLKEITLEKVISFYKDRFRNEGSHKRKLLIKILAQKLNNKKKKMEESKQEKKSKEGQDRSSQTSHNSQKNRNKILNIRKFKCENRLWNLPRLITDNLI